MGVPVLGRMRNVRREVSEGDLLLLDSNSSTLLVRPTAEMEEVFEAKLALRQKRRAVFAALKSAPPVTKDGHRLTVMANGGQGGRDSVGDRRGRSGEEPVGGC